MFFNCTVKINKLKRSFNFIRYIMDKAFPGGKLPGEDFINSWYPILIAIGIGILYAFRQYMRGAQCQSRENLKGKVAFVTGASGGIGFATTVELLERSAHVIMGVKDLQKGEEAIEKIRARHSEAEIDLIEIDMASFESIRNTANQIIKDYDKLNILINNAGVMCHPQEKSIDGFEIHLAINYLGPFLLTRLLLPKLRSNPGSRIVNVSAISYRIANLNIDDLNSENGVYSPGEAFSQSKLAILIDTVVLSKLIPVEECCINAVLPGVVNSGAQRHMGFKTNTILRITLKPLIWFLMKSPKDGAQSIIQAATADEEKDVTGKIYSECKMQDVELSLENIEKISALTKKAAEMTKCTEYSDINVE